MKLIRAFFAFLFVALPVSAVAQGGAEIDNGVRSSAFTSTDYDKMLACTLLRHPDETKRYAQYYLQRRSVQTPAQNESDPDSSLMIPALQGCFEFKNGQPIPFSLDRLTADWGQAHNIAAGVIVTDMASLANCVVRYNPSGARAYSQYRYDGTQPSAKNRRMLMYAMVIPPCVGSGTLSVDHNKLRKLILAAFSAQQVSK
jgi:hypothetical protein